MSYQELINLLMRRDNLSREEACALVDETADEIKSIVREEPNPFMSYNLVTEILESNLSLEPDYLDIFINEVI